MREAWRPLAYRYHLWVLLHASINWSFSTNALNSSPALLTLHILSSFKAAWNLRVSILHYLWLSMHFLPSAALWSSSLQVVSEIHGPDAVLSFFDGFLNLRFRDMKCESPSCLVPPFTSVIDQVARSLSYPQFLLAPSPMSTPSTIQWSVGIFGSLMPTMENSRRVFPNM